MTRQTNDNAGHGNTKNAARPGPSVRQSAVGILGAVVMALPAAGQAQSGEGLPAQDAADESRIGVVERFIDIGARLRLFCADVECGGIDGTPDSQINNWSDW